MARRRRRRSSRLRWLAWVFLPAVGVALLFLYGMPRKGRRGKGLLRMGHLPQQLVTEVEAQWKADTEQIRADSPEVLRMDAALRRRTASELEVVLQGAPAEPQMAVDSRLAHSVMADLIAARGAPWFRSLGVFFASRLGDELERRLPEIKEAEGLDNYRASLEPEGPDAQAFREVYGSFLLGVGVPSLLMRPRGSWHSDLPVYARAIFLYRWLNEGRALKKVELPMRPLERRVYLRWKVEHALPSSRESRLEALEQLVALEPEYEVAQSQALIWSQSLTLEQKKAKGAEGAPPSPSPGAP